MFKYVRTTIEIDRSSKHANNLDLNKKPNFTKEDLFLKVLIVGDATLYSFEGNNLTRFFFDNQNNEIKQLVFKLYLNADDKIQQNNFFRQQLYNSLKCKEISISYLEKIDYKANDLVKLFVAYNNCLDSSYDNFTNKEKKDFFNLSLKLGLNNTSFKIQNLRSNTESDFGNQLGLRFGLEAEFIMPFNRDKWSVFIEPTYQSFKTVDGAGPFASINYNSIEIPIGLRHYLFLSELSKFFVNAAFVFDFSGESTIGNLEVKTSSNLVFGLGYKHNNKYGVELRYYITRNLFYNYMFYTSGYNNISLIFGYNFF